MLSAETLTDATGRPYTVRKDGNGVVVTIFPLPNAQYPEQSIISLRLGTKETTQLIHAITA